MTCPSPVPVIACSVLKDELEFILSRDFPGVSCVFVDSMLHMHPEQLGKALERRLSQHGTQPCLVVYGDCHPHMKDMEDSGRIIRTPGVNCAEILLGHERYVSHRNRGSFLFLPEWTSRWRDIFMNELGFTDPQLAREFMAETRNGLVYLDTGIAPVPLKCLEDIRSFFGMAVTVEPVSLDHLARLIVDGVSRLERLPHEH